MRKTMKLSPEEQRRTMANRIWMEYFNSVLLEKAIISEEEHTRMKVKIDAHYGSFQ